MQLLEVPAIFAAEERSPELFEEHWVRTEDLTELGPVMAVYQSDQFGWTCIRTFHAGFP